jgi:hypothetical protein
MHAILATTLMSPAGPDAESSGGNMSELLANLLRPEFEPTDEELEAVMRKVASDAVEAAERAKSDLQRRGLAALKEALGVEGMVRFLQLNKYENGINDYTAERPRLLEENNNLTLDELMEEVTKRDRANTQLKPPRAFG